MRVKYFDKKIKERCEKNKLKNCAKNAAKQVSFDVWISEERNNKKILFWSKFPTRESFFDQTKSSLSVVIISHNNWLWIKSTDEFISPMFRDFSVEKKKYKNDRNLTELENNKLWFWSAGNVNVTQWCLCHQ